MDNIIKQQIAGLQSRYPGIASEIMAAVQQNDVAAALVLADSMSLDDKALYGLIMARQSVPPPPKPPTRH